MWTREQRLEAFKNWRIEEIDGKIYAVVTCDFGRYPDEVIDNDLYRRLQDRNSVPPKRGHWYGTTIAADSDFDNRRKLLEACRQVRRSNPSR